MKRLNFLSLFLPLFPFLISTDTDLMINTIHAISKNYHFQYYLIMSFHEKTQNLHHENLMKSLHSHMKLSTIVDINMEDPDKCNGETKSFKANAESRALIIFNGFNESDKIKFLKFSKNVNFGGNKIWLLFLTEVKKPLEEFVTLLALPFNSQLILAVVKGSKYVYFKAPYRVAENFPLRIPDIGSYSDTDGLNLPVIDVAVTRRDMEGFRLRAGTAHYPPVSTVIYDKNRKITAVGYLADVWKELSERLNFTYDYYIPNDNATGVMLPNGSWSGLLGMLIRKEIDAAVIHLSITKQRMEYVDFGAPIIFNRKKLFYLDVGNQFKWGNLFRPFSMGVWLAILVWFVVISIALAYFFKVECNRMRKNTLRKCDCTVLECFLIAFRAITNQGSDVTPQSLSSRIVFYLAYLTMVVIIPSYSAALISYLTVHTSYKPFDSLRSMLEKRTHYLAVILNTSDYSYFTESADPVLQEVLQKLIIPFNKKGKNPRNAKEGINLVCHSKNVAFLENYIRAEWHIDESFKKHGCKIASLETIVAGASETFGFQKESPYARIINLELKKIVHRGLLGRLRKKSYKKNEQKYNASSYKEIGLHHVHQIYSMLLSGLILSVLILTVEIYKSRRKRNEVTDKEVENERRMSEKAEK